MKYKSILRFKKCKSHIKYKQFWFTTSNHINMNQVQGFVNKMKCCRRKRKMVKALSLVLLMMVSCSIVFQPAVSLATETNQQDIGYLKYVKDASHFPPTEYYDYIVVGGGTAGCPLAATLSEKYSVLLLERGGTPNQNPNLLRQEKFLANLQQGNTKDSPVETFTSEDGVVNMRGRVLGGGTTINAGFYSRANKKFYNRSGIRWDMGVVEKSYGWVEDAVVYEPDISKLEWPVAVKEGLVLGRNGPYNGFNLDHVRGTKIGGSIFDRRGRRHHAAELLGKSGLNNLRVATHATAQKILLSPSFSGISAVGVVYTDSTGKFHQALIRNKGEVILSAGAIGSPQLLLLSGIGHRRYLTSLGIPVAKHHPNVGKFLADPPRNNINIIPPFPVQGSGLSVVGITNSGYYIEAMSSTLGFDSPSSPILFPYPSPPLNISVLSIVEKLSNTRSRGWLSLVSSVEAKVGPRVRFNYFSRPVDLASCVRGIHNIKQVMSSPVMDKYKFQDKNGTRYFQFVGSSWSDDEATLEKICRKGKTTIWHFHGGCVVGKVVDEDLRVVGVNGLRVVDGSVYTVSPGTNPQATTLMLGRYFGIKIQEQRKD